MELTVRLDDAQVQFLLDAFSRELDRRFRRHMKAHHRPRPKQVVRK